MANEKSITPTQDSNSKKARKPNRDYEQVLADYDKKIAYHEDQTRLWKMKKDQFVESRDNKKGRVSYAEAIKQARDLGVTPEDLRQMLANR